MRSLFAAPGCSLLPPTSRCSRPRGWLRGSAGPLVRSRGAGCAPSPPALSLLRRRRPPSAARPLTQHKRARARTPQSEKFSVRARLRRGLREPAQREQPASACRTHSVVLERCRKRSVLLRAVCMCDGRRPSAERARVRRRFFVGAQTEPNRSKVTWRAKEPIDDIWILTNAQTQAKAKSSNANKPMHNNNSDFCLGKVEMWKPNRNRSPTRKLNSINCFAFKCV